MIVFRNNKLVYISLNKHASTFHKKLFTDLNWEKIEFCSIDWETDTVFAHILNPFDKHLKATAEAIYRNNFQKLFDDPNLSKIAAWGILDYHAIPVVAMLGEEVCSKIDWIPLDGPIESNILTTKFFQHHNIPVDITNRQKIYVSDSTKKGYVNLIKDLINKHGTGSGIDMFYARDYYFYNQVVNKFNFNGNTWEEISWLKNIR